MDLDDERKLEVVCMAYHRMKYNGQAPDMTIADAGKAFGIEPKQANIISMRVRARLYQHGIPSDDAWRRLLGNATDRLKLAA